MADLTRREVTGGLLAGLGSAALLGLPGEAAAASVAYRQALAEAALDDKALARFYRERGYQGIWTGFSGRRRLRALLAAFAEAPVHGLPVEPYRIDRWRRRIRAARTEADLGRLEAELSRAFLAYVDDVQSGILEPHKLSKTIDHRAPRRDHYKTLEAFRQSTPEAFIRLLPPRSPGYAGMLRQKRLLEEAIASGGWGPAVRARKLEPGDSGAQVVALRNRLIRMGYLRRTASTRYDRRLQAAVQRFQRLHGLAPDGVAGKGTIAAINVGPEARLRQALISLERQRWLNYPLGKRHIFVNTADFMARLYDGDRVVWESRVVVGQRREEWQTAEFSDEMTHIIVNPSWYVPPSIMTKEYLPKLRNNPAALAREGIELTDATGRVIDPRAVDWSAYGGGEWPFSMRQPPGPGNALGKLKFMFPNRFNIYMHDTPAKSLFARQVRAYSHGCVRVHKPMEFAHALLAPQMADPDGYIRRLLATGEETRVDLAEPVPVHIVYLTAWIDDEGEAHFRDDIYGRDKLVWAALEAAGVRTDPRLS